MFAAAATSRHPGVAHGNTSGDYTGLTAISGLNVTPNLIKHWSPFTFTIGHFQAQVSGIYGF
ncbi:hypothetical protein DPMN_005214 [Dreissena polymorpha]|uniref:Uncharacterized protein n=1 Tax=Dreissena polymorpha TaxID=45954 RepID=A0A9D4MT26_DREPO|nr:hypothetical protein DPMN_005214 [Dreissena polymorpha]